MSKTQPKRIMFRNAVYELVVEQPTFHAPRGRQAAMLSDEEHQLLNDLVGLDAEGLGREDWKSAEADQEVVDQYLAFRAAAEAALETLEPLPSWLVDGVTVQDLVTEEGIYLILMTLRGEGVGIWDGSWDRYFLDPGKIKEVERYLKQQLASFADDTGGGSLSEAILNAASA